tara:strand:+ start:399 stop:731 length:333 start_codon:yes stop_codon:yes gene_type:complete
LLELNIIDEIVDEPLGGAHRDKNLLLQNLQDSIKKNLEYFKDMTAEEIYNNRKNKFLKIGRNKGFMNNVEDLSSLKIKENKLSQTLKNKKIVFSVLGLTLIVIISLITLL